MFAEHFFRFIEILSDIIYQVAGFFSKIFSLMSGFKNVCLVKLFHGLVFVESEFLEWVNLNFKFTVVVGASEGSSFF